ncbi:hypothetical protein [Piscinibacterium candidicorallinum]|uniref:Outer membrane protein beta-barrel domain-containing protein n=1 Tax=Piscinibacterium candidicorallinum TaxID=1793872 RepID=A0ABV7HBK1_9BURK
MPHTASLKPRLLLCLRPAPVQRAASRLLGVAALLAALATPLTGQAQDVPVVPERMVGVERDVRSGADGGSDDPRSFRGIASFGLTLGGSRVGSVNSAEAIFPDLYAGNLWQANVGAQWRLGTRLSVSGTLGYHTDEASDDSYSLRFSRFPIEALAHLDLNRNLRIGGGARYVDRAWLTLRSRTSENTRDTQTLARYGHNLGWVGEVEYLFHGSHPADSKLGVKLRYVRETYPLRGSVRKFSGSHMGVFVTAYF